MISASDAMPMSMLGRRVYGTFSLSFLLLAGSYKDSFVHGIAYFRCYFNLQFLFMYKINLNKFMDFDRPEVTKINKNLR